MSTEIEILAAARERFPTVFGTDHLLEHALAELHQQERLVEAVGAQHKLVLSCNEALTEGNTNLRARAEKAEADATKYKAALVKMGAIPDEPLSPMALAQAQFKAKQEEAQTEMLKTSREDRALLIDRLRTAEQLLREARAFAPNPDRISEFLGVGGA